MGRPERPVDPQAGPVERLAWALRRLREEAGRPSYRELAERAHYSRSTLAEVATGLRLPTLEATLAYAIACGGDRKQWEDRWHEAAGELERSQRRCPYPGLAPFGTEDADLFFGRRTLTADLVTAVGGAPLAAVVGASGSGKSSLLLAGLLPALRAKGTPAAVITPGAHPLDELAAGISTLTGANASSLREDLGTAPPTVEIAHTGDRHVLVIDQFEEAFTLCGSEDERDAFLGILAHLVSTAGEHLTVVLGIRADFYGNCAEHADLVAALRENVHMPIGPMTAGELREIVTRPAAHVGLQVEPELVATVLGEADGQPGALPLIAHALRETWSGERDSTLRLAGYQATGGLREAIARTAEDLYADLDDEDRTVVRAVFLRLTALGEGTADTRRRVSRDELTGIGQPGEVDGLLDRLAAARLIVTGHDTVEIAHEALIRAWPRLAGWLRTDREDLLLHRRLTDAAAEWDSSGRQDEYLYHGNRLAPWNGRDTTAFNELETAFLKASRGRRDREERLARRRVRLTVGGLSVTAIVVSILAVVAFVQAGNATSQRDGAYSREIAANARRQLENDPELALLLAIEAYETKPTEAADAALRQALVDSRLRRTGRVPPRRPSSSLNVSGMSATAQGQVATWSHRGGFLRHWSWDGRRMSPAGELPQDFSRHSTAGTALHPDGRSAATLGGDGLYIWDLSQGAPAAKATRLSSARLTGGKLALGADGRVAVATRHTLRLWDSTGRRKTVTVRTPVKYPGELAFSPDGKRLATHGNDGVVRLWDMTREKPAVIRSGAGTSSGLSAPLAYSPDGEWVALGGLRGTAMWHVPTWKARKPFATLDSHGGQVTRGMTFSPDGNRIATYGADRTVRVSTSGSGAGQLIMRPPPGEEPGGAFFSGDGRTLTTLSSTGGVLRSWDVASDGAYGGAPLRGIPFNSWTKVISADGKTLATAATRSRRTTIRVWRDTTRGGEPVILDGIASSDVRLALSGDGRRLAAAAGDGTIRLWDLAGANGTPVLFRTGEGPPVHVVLSPDGLRVAAFGRDGTVRVWNSGGGTKPVATLPPLWTVERDGRPVNTGLDLAEARRARRPGLTVIADQPRGSMAFSPDGRLLASPRGNDTVAVWDLAGHERPRIFTGGTVSETAHRAVTFSPSGRRLAAAGTDGVIRIWDTGGSADPVNTLRGQQSETRSLTFSPDGTWLAAKEPDGTLRMWRATARGDSFLIHGTGAYVSDAAFSPDGKRVTMTLGNPVAVGRATPTGLGDHLVRVWRCEVCGTGGEVLELARKRVTRSLTSVERKTYLERPE